MRLAALIMAACVLDHFNIPHGIAASITFAFGVGVAVIQDFGEIKRNARKQ